MEINDYEDLSEFAYNQCDTMADSLGLPTAPKKVIRFLETKLIVYLRLYDKPLYKKAKRDLQINHILETYPPSFFWKLFHPKLNKLVEQEKKRKEEWEKHKNEQQCHLDEMSVQYPIEIHTQTQSMIEMPPDNEINNDFDFD